MTGIVNSKNMRLTALVYDMAMAGLAMYAALILRLGSFNELDNYSLVGPFNGLDDYSLVIRRDPPLRRGGGGQPAGAGNISDELAPCIDRGSHQHRQGGDAGGPDLHAVCFVVNRLY